MRTSLLLRPLIATLLAASAFPLFAADDSGKSAPNQPSQLTQPVAPVRPVTDEYFGQKVVDNYRWMEDLKSPELQKWVKAQAAYTADYLSKLPDRDALFKRIQALDNASTRIDGVVHCGDRYFYMKITPVDQTPKLYVRDGLDGAERLLVDPQVLGGSGKRYAISGYSPSPDGKFTSVEIAAGGSELGTIRIIDAATGKPLKDTIDRVWDTGVSWGPDDATFFYTRLQKLAPGMELEKENNEAAWLHRVGDPVEKDVPVLGRLFNPPIPMVPTQAPAVVVTPGSPYALGFINNGVKNEMIVLVSPADAAEKGKPQWTKIVDEADEITQSTTIGSDLWLLSHKDAPRFKILHVDLTHPDLAKAEVTVPESDRVIRELGAAKDALYYIASKNAIAEVHRIPHGQTAVAQVQLPYVGSIQGSFTDVQHDGILLQPVGWTEAPEWYAYDPAADKLTNTGLEARNPVDFSDITSDEVTAPSADGTEVPLSIIHRKDLKLDGKNPCLMEGYGSYGISIEPRFDATRLALLERGIVIAWAHPRGGGENGEDWHLGGKIATKQNTIKDYIGCAEYLIKNGWTSSDRLGMRGTSAGGITIGGALTQRPDLMALAIINVGVVNILRVEAEPNGASNTPEFGTIKDPEQFKALYGMDAFQHVKDGTKYPAVLLITGANDPRVDPVELFKMTARLQAATSSGKPVLLRVDTDAGHGIGSTKKQRDLISADQAALLLHLMAAAGK